MDLLMISSARISGRRETINTPATTLAKNSVNLVRLSPLNRPMTNGLLATLRHAYVCGKCKKHKKVTNSFLHKEGSPKKSMCMCKPLKSGTTHGPLSLSGLKATQNKRRQSNQTLPKPTFSEEPGWRFGIVKGNNSKLVATLIENRNNWSITEDLTRAHFIWHPTSTTVRFDRLVPYLPMQIVNHFEGHSELSNKLKLYRNYRSYCEEHGLELGMPKSLEIDLKSPRLHSQLVSVISQIKNQGVWVLKPAACNRGRGISLFNSPPRLKSLVNQLKQTPGASRFIVQKYIEAPLLYNSRKFDVRVWVLVTNDMKAYFYREGYLRTSSLPYTAEQLDLKFIHLTNNAVQKHGEFYGSHEDGNQLSFVTFREIVEQHGRSFDEVLDTMKKMLRNSLLAVAGKLNPNKYRNCFELFGYDFLVDSDIRLWMIECNTNPCLELSSKLLERLIPRMLEGCLQLTVDPVFKPESPTSEDYTNHWEFLVKL